jgi:hypothetical protein
LADNPSRFEFEPASDDIETNDRTGVGAEFNWPESQCVFIALAVMLAAPDPAAVVFIVKVIIIENRLDVLQADLMRVFRGHLVAGHLDNHAQLMADLRIEVRRP